jgi:4'-phosphopantetheinyl transferase
MVALAGCIAPPTPTSPTDGGPSPPSSHIGIDITCTTERERRNSQSIPKTEAELRAFIEIFSEVFSDREIQDMKSPSAPAPQSIHDRLRRFYTYWALKEAYIKLTGEALLAPWLRQLEFVDVVVPEPPMQMVDDDRPEFGAPYAGTRILLHGKELKDVRIEVVALGDEYIFATAAKGPGIGKPIVVDADEGSNTESPVDRWNPFRPIDIESDIGPCARAECRCLDSKVV